ncbi:MULTISPECIES: hypothetical protein [Bacillaceae]|uniref:Uncharacterized protein n=1 Tax=Evansella alkalicola TaxID=745819 RepID=A0ABS6JRD6_9BACI|nr:MULTISPECIES: hypothetical protein [Bacillaceae]MBU9721053.1 hypothetical protein [Bacillus alkalicola]
MFQTLKKKFEAKQAVWAAETQRRIREYAEQERKASLEKMEKEQMLQRILNEEVNKYLRTVHPTFLLKPEAYKALLNMLHARSEGLMSLSITMTKEMRKVYSFYHNELEIFLKLLEKKGFKLEGKEDLFLTTFLNTLRENNYKKCLEHYGDFVPEGSSILEAFERYFDVVDDHLKYESGNVDFFATYLNRKEIADFTWTKSRLKRKLKHYESVNKDRFKMKQLERRLENIS